MFAETVQLKQGESISLTTGQVETAPTARKAWIEEGFKRNDPAAIFHALYWDHDREH